MNDEEKTRYKICLLTIGILGSFLFIVTGYWIAAAIGISQSDSVGFWKGVNRVLSDPFAAYFNNYTPIVMILAFIIFESLFFFYMVYSRKKERISQKILNAEENNVTSTENGVVSEANNDFLLNLSGTGHNEALQMENSDLISGFGIISQEDISSTLQDDTGNASGESAVERVEEFNDDMTMELLEYYDLQQITAMLKLTKYIDNISIDMLKRMFQPSMPAAEIGEYIKIFYE